MKKQKFMRLSAFTSAPALENSFSSPVGFQGEISVVFRGKAVSIHGWDGSSWTTIYIWNGIDPQFKFENTYQNYYIKSFTGQEEIMPVSFFSVGRIENSVPQFAGINRETKLHDIEEVPVYTASDEGKMLTVMSNGSLAWLLATESFNVEGGVAGPSQPAQAQVDWIEESVNLDAGFVNPSTQITADGILDVVAVTGGDNNKVRFSPYFNGADYLPEVTREATFSIWFKKTGDTLVDKKPTPGHMPIFSNTLTAGVRMEVLNGNELRVGGAWKYPFSGSDVMGTLSSSIEDGNWHHVILSVEYHGNKNYTYHVMVDGQAVQSFNKTFSTPSTDIGISCRGGSSQWVGIGWKAYPGGTMGYEDHYATGQFNAFEIKAGTVLTESQMLSLYQAGQGGMSIEDASQQSAQPANSYIDFSAVSGLVNNNGATINGTSVSLTKSSSQYLNLGDSADWDRSSGEDFAVSVDFKFNSFLAGQTYDIVSKGEEGIWQGWGIMVYSGGLRQFAHSGGQAINSNLGFDAAFTPVVGQWYTARCIWKNSGTQEMWIDGVKVAERTVALGYLPPVDSSYDLRVGYGFDDSATRHFDGEIRNVLIEKGTIA